MVNNLDEHVQTFREKLYVSVEPEQYAEVDAMLIASNRGSERIEGVQRPRLSYEVSSPKDLPRVPFSER